MLITRRGMLRLAVGAGIAGFSSAAYGLGIEPRFLLGVQRHEVRPAGWPAGLKLRIAALSDPHLGEPYMPLDRWAEIVDATNALRPDLIVMRSQEQTSELQSL